MRILITAIMALGLTIGSSGCFIEDEVFSDTLKEEKTLTFQDVDRIELSNITGSIEVSGWDKDYVEVYYKKQASREETLEKLQVNARQDGNSLVIETDYPRHCRNCGISFRVQLPRSMEEVELATVTGSVKLLNMERVERVRAKTVTGSLKAELSARECDFESVTGSIRAEFARIDKDLEISASLTTGSINLYLPENFAGEISLSTVTGSISTDFPVTMSGKISRRKIGGSVGNGSGSIRASTVTGSVNLNKR